MSTDEVLAEAATRGLSFVLGQDGTPRIRGPKEQVTPAFLRVIQRWHRDEIVRRLLADRPQPPTPEPRPVPELPAVEEVATPESPPHDQGPQSVFRRVFGPGLSLDGLERLRHDLLTGNPACLFYTEWWAGLQPVEAMETLLLEVDAEIAKKRQEVRHA